MIDCGECQERMKETSNHPEEKYLVGRQDMSSPGYHLIFHDRRGGMIALCQSPEIVAFLAGKGGNP